MKPKILLPAKIGHRTDGDHYMSLEKRIPGTPGVPQHLHVNIEVAYQLSGERIYDYSGKRFTMHEGDVLIIPPGTMHGLVPSSCYSEAYVLGYTPSLIYSRDISFRNLKYLLAFSGEHSFERCRFSGNSSELRCLRAEFLQLAEYGNFPKSELLARATILKMHDRIYQLYNGFLNEKTSELIVAVESYITERISEDISPIEIANYLHISHSSLCHRLKAGLNCTPNELVMRCKLNFAENLLLNRRDLTVTEVGSEIGIVDTSYFIKCFKKSRGITPNEFRKITANNTADSFY